MAKDYLELITANCSTNNLHKGKEYIFLGKDTNFQSENVANEVYQVVLENGTVELYSSSKFYSGKKVIKEIRQIVSLISAKSCVVKQGETYSVFFMDKINDQPSFTILNEFNTLSKLKTDYVLDKEDYDKMSEEEREICFKKAREILEQNKKREELVEQKKVDQQIQKKTIKDVNNFFSKFTSNSDGFLVPQTFMVKSVQELNYSKINLPIVLGVIVLQNIMVGVSLPISVLSSLVTIFALHGVNKVCSKKFHKVETSSEPLFLAENIDNYKFLKKEAEDIYLLVKAIELNLICLSESKTVAPNVLLGIQKSVDASLSLFKDTVDKVHEDDFEHIRTATYSCILEIKNYSEQLLKSSDKDDNAISGQTLEFILSKLAIQKDTYTSLNDFEKNNQ